jgi:NAD(P)-dependent dehydrogenase (short-subunit alcohol dehydrogenase family)
MMDLGTAKHAFVTGGASGLGLAMGKAIAARGIRVTIVDANRETLSTVLASKIADLRGAYLDVRDRAGWAAVKKEAEAAFGPVDILINNAGIAPNLYEFADMDPASFDQIIAINLTGVFNGVSAFAADMRARGRGHIVITSSMAGISRAMPGTGPYTASKFGVAGLGETLREELAPHGVGVSVLCPGLIGTPLMENTRKLGIELRLKEATLNLNTPFRPEDLAALVLKGIAENAPYIVTQPDEWWARVEERFAVLAKAFGRAG